MSLVGSDVWTRSEQLLRESSRALGVAIQSPKESGFQRVYMFSFPVFNKIARLDRERQLFNATMQDHILHEHRRNPWFKRTFFALFYLTAFWMLFYSPPQFLEKHPFYTNINRLKAAGKKQAAIWWLGYRTHIKEREKVWINGLQPVLDLLRKQAKGRAKEYQVDESARRIELIRQINELENKSPTKNRETVLGPGDVMVLVVRGQVRTEAGRQLAAKDLIREGALITTEARAFVKLWFADGSILSLGPSSQVKVGKSNSGKISVVDLLAGSLRTNVTKAKDKPASDSKAESDQKPYKFYLKTKTAVVGVRGTDFYVAHNPVQNATYLLTLEGRVSFVKLLGTETDPVTKLDSDSGVREVAGGSFSEARPDLPEARVAAPAAPAQMDAVRMSLDVQGESETSIQKDSLQFAQLQMEEGEWVSGSNRNADRYQSLTPEQGQQWKQLEDLGRKIKPRPKKEDYKLVPRPPSDLAPNKREFPDLF